MSKLFLGVDGGGSKTELCVADGSGKTLLTLNGGATSFKSVGNAAAFANMRELVRQMERAGFRAEHIQRSVWGMSGCDTPADRVVYEAMIQQAGFPEAQTTVVNDALLPFWAAADVPGVVVIAGTGSIVVGIDSQGHSQRIGGWNYSFSDLGSGYWMSCRLLREMTLWLDGCREDCFTFRAVEKKLLPQGGGREEMLYRLTNLTKGDEISSFASIVLETAQSPLCKKLRQGAVDSLTLYAGRMLENLHAQGEQNLKIVLSGGLFKSDCFRAQALEAMEKLAPVVVNTVSPALGGVRIAQKLG